MHSHRDTREPLQSLQHVPKPVHRPMTTCESFVFLSFVHALILTTTPKTEQFPLPMWYRIVTAADLPTKEQDSFL